MLVSYCDKYRIVIQGINIRKQLLRGIQEFYYLCNISVNLKLLKIKNAINKINAINDIKFKIYQWRIKIRKEETKFYAWEMNKIQVWRIKNVIVEILEVAEITQKE